MLTKFSRVFNSTRNREQKQDFQLASKLELTNILLDGLKNWAKHNPNLMFIAT